MVSSYTQRSEVYDETNTETCLALLLSCLYDSGLRKNGVL